MLIYNLMLQLHTHEVIEICAKILYQVELCRGNLDIMWGFSVEAELVENNERQDELCCYVSRVEERSVAITNGNDILNIFYISMAIKIEVLILIKIIIFVAISRYYKGRRNNGDKWSNRQ